MKKTTQHGSEPLASERPESSSEAELAYLALTAEYAAVPDDALATPNLNLATAVSRALRGAPVMLGMRAQIAEELPTFRLAHADRLQRLALGLWHCYLHSDDAGARSPLGDLIAEGRAARAQLMADARALAGRKLLPREEVDRIAEQQGDRNQDLCHDLGALPKLFRAHWASVSGKTGVTLEELAHCDALALQVLTALSDKSRAGGKPEESPGRHLRAALTLLTEAYDECRRAVSYLRWDEGDVDAKLPSLRAQSGARKRPANGEPPAGAPPASA